MGASAKEFPGETETEERQRVYLLHRVGNAQGSRLLVAARMAVMNFVLVVIDESRDGAVGANGPAREDIQESYGIEIQRICILPVRAIAIAEIFPIWSDGPPLSIIDVSHSGAGAAALPRCETPGLALM